VQKKVEKVEKYTKIHKIWLCIRSIQILTRSIQIVNLKNNFERYIILNVCKLKILFGKDTEIHP